MKLKNKNAKPVFDLAVCDVIGAEEKSEEGKISLRLKAHETGEILEREYDAEIDPEGLDGQELSALLGKPLDEQTSAKDLITKRCIALRYSRRGSGGRLVTAAGPLLTASMILAAAAKLKEEEQS
jgi:hypothetical protein